MSQLAMYTPPLSPGHISVLAPPTRSESGLRSIGDARSPVRNRASGGRRKVGRTRANVVVAKGVPPHVGTSEVARMVEAALGLSEGHVDERRSLCILNRSVTFLQLRRPAEVPRRVHLHLDGKECGVVEASDTQHVRTKDGHSTVNARFVLCRAGDLAGSALRFRPEEAEEEALRLSAVIQRATGLRCVKVAFPCRPHQMTDSRHCYSQLFVDFGDCRLAAEAVARGDGFPCTIGEELAALRLEPVDPGTFTKARWVECTPEPATPTSCNGLSHLDDSDGCSDPPSLLDVDSDAD
eukprot:TRINITY_DN1411_c0_g2_i1.p1 TRINITY_DN1411_c0_g2~~TRINITY_DN1411_c0_g2_i1.p1  ORF type:complete len:295 (+),score=50.56 TRINITY_DN1411_c0_g2_i1:124-1008(+)